MNNNETTNNVNTNGNNEFNLFSLPFDKGLLTEREQKWIEEGWDGEAVLAHPGTPLVVDVHDKEFHTDDVFSCVLIDIFNESKKGKHDGVKTIIRSRDPKNLEAADIRVDVGEGLLDHHGSRADKAHGVAACTRIFALLTGTGAGHLRSYVWQKLADITKEIAATDCGNAAPNWISGTVQMFNRLALARASKAPEKKKEQIFTELFWTACKTVEDYLDGLLEIWNAEADALWSASQEIYDAGPCSKIVVFSKASRMAPVKEMMWNLKCKAWFFVSPESENDWRVLCCADPEKEYSDFSSVRLIPTEFCGWRDVQLDAKTHLTGGIFSHKDGFIAGFKTRQAAIDFATLCVTKIQEQENK